MTDGPWYVEHGQWGWAVRSSSKKQKSFGGQDNIDAYVAFRLKKEDAVLIASAPDLVAALKDIANNYSDGETYSGTHCAEIARAALQKAGVL